MKEREKAKKFAAENNQLKKQIIRNIETLYSEVIFPDLADEVFKYFNDKVQPKIQADLKEKEKNADRIGSLSELEKKIFSFYVLVEKDSFEFWGCSPKQVIKRKLESKKAYMEISRRGKEYDFSEAIMMKVISDCIEEEGLAGNVEILCSSQGKMYRFIYVQCWND